jgi:PAS domain S-box-containing protein
MSLKSKLNLISLIMVVFLTLKTTVLLDITPSSSVTRGAEYILFFITSYFLYSFIKQFLKNDKENKKLITSIESLSHFINESVIVSRADTKGKITYVNKKFEEISGWSLDEVIGQDHKIVNSGRHPKEMWAEMYETTLKHKKVWNAIVTNKSKTGELYWVDTYIKAEFNDKGQFVGFMSIRYDVTEIILKTEELENKNTYLEHAAKILRHDMHSGINTYMPRGLSSLERRLKPEDIENLKIEAPIKMIKEGLKHSQKVYKGVYEFTNLVKKDVVLNKTLCNLKDILIDYLSSTAYLSQVIIEDLPEVEVNEALFCTAVDNLIRNGLKYNDSDTKFVKITFESDALYIQDNGRGITQEDFEYLSKPYVRKEGQKESGTGLGLNICVAILKEHGFSISCEKNEIGTKMKIKLK